MRFEVVAYSTGPDDRSPMRERLERGFDRFVDAAGWPALRLAQSIRNDGIDILVDLKGHTEGAPPSVLALRPAPIQVHYLGYPGTLGGESRRLPDRRRDRHAGSSTPATMRRRSRCLPGSYQINDRARPIADNGRRGTSLVSRSADRAVLLQPRLQAQSGGVRCVDADPAEVPDAVLWLLARPGEECSSAICGARWCAAASMLGGSHFALARANPDYLALYRVADLFLDTWPYNAHTTASDALWAGCPVVTLARRHVRCRGSRRAF